MQQVFYQVPWYLDEIVEQLTKRNWLVHNFNIVNNDDLYNPASYLRNAEFDNTKYLLRLDLNIYQFLLNIIKKEESKSNYRDAAALLVFCQTANIHIDPTFPVYEKINYDEENLLEALPDLELFHNINNGEMDELAKYALAYESSISLSEIHKLNHEEMATNLMKYKKLKEWDSLYLLMLSIVDINNSSIPQRQKLSVFLEWMVEKFRMSLVATVYAIVLFGDQPIKRMMKFKKSLNIENKRHSVSNMTWDLYIMTQFFRNWTEKDENEEYLFASDDGAFCKLLRLAINVQKSQDFSPIKHLMNQSEYKGAIELLDLDNNTSERMYKSQEWGVEYRAKLISDYEKKLYI